VRGASALEKVLEEEKTVPLRVLVVWEPVIDSDVGPPSARELARVSDKRATQFWDERRLLSQEMVEAARADAKHPERAERLKDEGIVWDFVAIFPPGARWEARVPEPDYYFSPVVKGIGDVRTRLRAAPR